eukprot:CAMPEP_0172739806 /NCGR_PEP_ID=MMETSP1074-20121228/123365_1 /TAXON_ID=2916 /ORGANISM="Ceratium fusus, Strain PA161109" /LENGTH=113 /DNA_ID=CAMNT_0013569767 /DNA_START=105 /DNA_END=442 /DNA_ORIENTATION=+
MAPRSVLLRALSAERATPTLSAPSPAESLCSCLTVRRRVTSHLRERHRPACEPAVGPGAFVIGEVDHDELRFPLTRPKAGADITLLHLAALALESDLTLDFVTFADFRDCGLL